MSCGVPGVVIPSAEVDTDYQLASFGCRLLFNIFWARPSVLGREHLEDLEPPYLVACNHSSLIDPALLVGFFPEAIRFMAKAELADKPWIGFLEKRLGNIHLNRDGRDIGPIRQALKELKSGDRCLVVFLEGTRTEEGSGLAEAKQGAAMLAARSGAPVVPVYLENTGRAAPPGTLVPTFYPIRVHIGAPVDLGLPDKKPDEAALVAATERIREAILALRPQEG